MIPLFERVQLEKEHRSNLYKIYNVENEETKKGRYSQYALSRMVVCGECGRFYRRVTSVSYKRLRSGETLMTWRCNNRMEYGKRFCKQSPTMKEKSLHESVISAINHLIRNKRSTIKRLKKQIAHEHSLNNTTYSLEDMMAFLKASVTEVTEFNEAIVRKLLDKITVISKDKLLIRFKDGTEIEQEIIAKK